MDDQEFQQMRVLVKLGRGLTQGRLRPDSSKRHLARDVYSYYEKAEHRVEARLHRDKAFADERVRQRESGESEEADRPYRGVPGLQEALGTVVPRNFVNSLR